ncbi:MAG: hypothetical protein QGG36_24220 [Pirellulaceae bacterium]|jgi:uncharacterized protein involved in exopolysaccharide biosynthesis|nr:hypothetical protein [Pirellulaceae bacterium]MDP7018925.1 hypothetical protein [Pirellulaceae bacterium]
MQANPLLAHWKSFSAALRTHWRIIAVPVIAFPILAAAFALVQQPTWKASQALLIRDETSGEDARIGRFDSIDAMKTAQETIVEISRNRSVGAASLTQAGPPTGRATTTWPTSDDVAQLLDRISITAPKGAEFGRTEVFYLSVKDSDRQRAVLLATAVCDQLDERLRAVRNEKAAEVILELERTTELAQQALDDVTGTLETFERQVGSDLGELRSLNELGSGDSNLRIASNEIKNETRQAEATLQLQQELLRVLREAAEDPDRIVATPNRLLEAQPSLRKLKEGLVDAQLLTARLLGTMSEDHPRVRSARSAEQEVRRDLHRELGGAVLGLASDIEVSERRVAALQQKLTDVTKRLDSLAGVRARYHNLVAQVRHKTTILEESAKKLAAARAVKKGAETSSLLTRIDRPDTGDGPTGPGRFLIVLAGLAGGLAASGGLTFLLAPVNGQDTGRRWTDQLWGRRKNDSTQSTAGCGSAPQANSRQAEDRPGRGRRADDRPTEPPAAQPPARQSSSADPNDERSPDDRRTGDRRQGKRRQ